MKRVEKTAAAAAVAATAFPALRLIFVLVVIAWPSYMYYNSSVSGGWALLGSGNGGGGDRCRGRYIYVHDLPPRFNADILSDCSNISGSRHWPGMCRVISNSGAGMPLTDEVDGVLTGANGWYGTDQFALDVIFHNRMMQYDCLTRHSSVADAVFVPFYAGFDFVVHLWGYDDAARDAASADLMEWLVARPEWSRMGGRDHFLVAGRTGWDFSRSNGSTWGTNLLDTPGGRAMSVLAVETTLRHDSLCAVPYPTYFHPRKDADVLRWQARVRKHERPLLMAFVGAPRPDNPANIRKQIIAQCDASAAACSKLECATRTFQCHSPGNTMRHFQKASFCLQPYGDSFTRRSTFDSIMAGCIPVFFLPETAYAQYTWHLPRDHSSYSVLIPEDDVRDRNVSIEAALRAIPPATVERMREEVIRLIPTVIYADPRSKLETMKDAFDVTVDGIIDRVARLRSGAAVRGNTRAAEEAGSSVKHAMARFFFPSMARGGAADSFHTHGTVNGDV